MTATDRHRASSSGFDLVYRADIPAAPGAVLDTVARVQDWWNPAHTYSGRATNLKLEPRAGGCFCESWDGGSVEHARVVQVLRDRVLRLEGSLGPLQAMAEQFGRLVSALAKG